MPAIRRALARCCTQARLQLGIAATAAEALCEALLRNPAVAPISLGAPIAMAYVPTADSTASTRLYAEVRGKRLPLVVSPMPFVPTRYKRSPS